MAERKKVGLALGSGGARGFCHVGVLKVFEENNIPIDVITGCSMGSIVGACYASGVGVEELIEFSEKLTQAMLLDVDITLKNQGLLKGNRAINIIKKFIGDKTYADCKIPFAATCVDAELAELITFTEGRLDETVRASMSIPGVFRSVEIGDKKTLIDGGIMERIPIRQAKQLGADVVIAVDALGAPQKGQEIKTIVDMIERSYNLLDWESAQHKMKEADLLITPEQGTRSIHLFKHNMDSIQAGIVAAEQMLPQIKELVF